MRRPRVGRVPLQARLDERRWERAVVAVHHHVDRRERAERRSLVRQHLARDDAVPEWIEVRGGEDGVARVGREVEVIERELGGIPQEVEDRPAKVFGRCIM